MAQLSLIIACGNRAAKYWAEMFSIFFRLIMHRVWGEFNLIFIYFFPSEFVTILAV